MAMPDPRDISELQKAVNEASSRTTALWVSFMTFAAYLIVAAGSVNHLALFRETAIRLPVLNADLPLVAFFAVAPFFLILFHFYLFLNLVTLARRIATYNGVLVEAVAAENDRNLLRTRLDTFLVVQLLARPSKSRTGPNVWLLNIVVWITLVGVPILILLQFQLTFLPYHLSAVTWIHRFFIVADLALIWFFWFAIYRRGELHFPRVTIHPVALAGSIVVSLISFVVVAYPGEPLGQLVRVKLPMVCSEKLVPISDCFLRGPVNMVTGQPQRYFFNVLVLPFQTLTDVKKAEAGQETNSLRGRDLSGAILIRSDIRGMDFTGTNLDGARLDFAVAPGAKFGCDDIGAPPPKNPDWPDHGCSSLRGASLYGANLSGAKFFGARMEGSILIHANLSGANLQNVHLEATVLTRANFTAAYMGLTRLQDAYLFNTNLAGATVKDSQLDGALLEYTNFEFASLGHLGSVRVSNTVGQPILDFAAFDLDGSSVPPPAHDVDFKDMRNRMLSVLLDEEKRRAPWFGTASGSAQGDGFSIFTPSYYESFYNDANKKTDWSKVKSSVTDLWMKNTPADTGEEHLEGFKRRFLSDRFAEMACDTENAPFVARGLIWNDIIVRADLLSDSFLTKVRDAQSCRGAVGLKPEDYGAIAAKRSEAKLGRPVMDKTDIRSPAN